MPMAMLSLCSDSSWKGSSASLNLSRGSCWSKMRRVTWSACSLTTAITCLKPTMMSSVSPFTFTTYGFSNWMLPSWHLKRKILPSSQQYRLLFSAMRTIWNFCGSCCSWSSPPLTSCSVFASLTLPSGVVMSVKSDWA